MSLGTLSRNTTGGADDGDSPLAASIDAICANNGESAKEASAQRGGFQGLRGVQRTHLLFEGRDFSGGLGRELGTRE